VITFVARLCAKPSQPFYRSSNWVNPGLTRQARSSSFRRRAGGAAASSPRWCTACERDEAALVVAGAVRRSLCTGLVNPCGGHPVDWCTLSGVKG